jgi:hypothetical protein
VHKKEVKMIDAIYLKHKYLVGFGKSFVSQQIWALLFNNGFICARIKAAKLYKYKKGKKSLPYPLTVLHIH